MVALYLGGAFDRALAPLGLNFHSCIETPFGAFKCGDEKTALENEVEAANVAAEREYRKLHPAPSEEELGPAERRESERESRKSQALLKELELECRQDARCRAELKSEP